MVSERILRIVPRDLDVSSSALDFREEGRRFEIESDGCCLMFAPRSSRPAYLETRLFGISYRGGNPLNETSLEVLQHELLSLEEFWLARVTRASFVHVLHFLTEDLAGYRRLHSAAERLNPEQPVVLTLADMRFLRWANQEESLERFAEDKRGFRRQVLSAVTEDFKGRAHTTILGAARTGSGWLCSVAQEVLGSCLRIQFGSDGTAVTTDNGCRLDDLSDMAGQPTFGLFDPEGLSLVQSLAVVCAPGKRLVVRSAKEHDPMKKQFKLLRSLRNMRYLYTCRDPRNVMLSRRSFFADKAPGRSRKPSVWKAVGICLQLQLEVQDLGRRLGGLEVRYEDLLANPEVLIGRIAAFLGVDLDDSSIAEVAHRIAFKTQSGGREYGDLRDGRDMRGGSDFRRELSVAERRQVRKKLGRSLRELGYEE